MCFSPGEDLETLMMCYMLLYLRGDDCVVAGPVEISFFNLFTLLAHYKY